MRDSGPGNESVAHRVTDRRRLAARSDSARLRVCLMAAALMLSASSAASALSFSVEAVESVGAGVLVGHPTLGSFRLFTTSVGGSVDVGGELQDGGLLDVTALSVSADLWLAGGQVCELLGTTAGCPPVTLTIELDASRASHLHARQDVAGLLLSGEVPLILSAFGESAAATLLVSERSTILFHIDPLTSFISPDAFALDGTLTFVSPGSTVPHGMQFLRISSVPEPTSAALLGLGLLALARRRDGRWIGHHCGRVDDKA